MKRERILHMYEKEWHHDTLELQCRARKLLLDHGYPKSSYGRVSIDVRQDLRVYYSDKTITVSFNGDRVYTGHDDTGPWFDDDDMREQISAALVVLRQYMILNDLANI
jgi:hypothetical protein